MSGNNVEFAALTYAIYKLGAVLVPLNPSFNASQVIAALRLLGVKVLIISAITDLAYKPGFGRSNESLLSEVLTELSAGTAHNGTENTLDAVIVIDNTHNHPNETFTYPQSERVVMYESLLHGTERSPDLPLDLDANDTATIQFTSGTTSSPKAAMLSHRSILNNALFIAQRMGMESFDRVVVPPPLFHCFGSVLGYLAVAATGATILFPSPAFDPRATVEMCCKYNATGLYGVTTMMLAVLDSLPECGTPTSLRKGIVAGSTVPEALMQRIYDKLGLEDLVICYGMTETSPVSCMTSPFDPFEKRCSSVGRPMPHTLVKIVNPLNRSRVMPINKPGELAISGYLVMKGYYGNQEQTDAVRVMEPNGPVTTAWMYSGDEAIMDENGYVSITGRIKDLIIRGGENVHPLEIENCLLQLPGIMEAAVVGIPDDRLGETICAFIILHRGWNFSQECGTINTSDVFDETTEYQVSKHAIQRWIRVKLSSHLVPKAIFHVGELPKTASGKVQKFVLRQWASDMNKAS
ncbi:hypothetical protein NLG97_g2619 [Lecanicillium saksenae]|uniref:Uncharacterized protein n=1 Tax=Lecanicillium saksenae TaxID=468837 RepID=A0ACC1R252_9HYPO|nr:hypothetical protein NLG97_g2619 [Lecanicillium saksenae]